MERTFIEWLRHEERERFERWSNMIKNSCPMHPPIKAYVQTIKKGKVINTSQVGENRDLEVCTYCGKMWVEH